MLLGSDSKELENTRRQQLGELEQLATDYMLEYKLYHFVLSLNNVLKLYTDEPNSFRDFFNNLEKLRVEKTAGTSGTILWLLIKKALPDYQDLVLKLIELDVSTVHSKNEFAEETCLHDAAKSGCPKVVEALLTKKASPNVLNKRSVTPLGACVEQMTKEYSSEQIEIFKLLIAAGADPKIGEAHCLPIFTTCVRYNLQAEALAIIDRVDVNADGHVKGIFLPIHFAALNANLKLAKALVDQKAEVNKLALTGGMSVVQKTPLHLAVQRKSSEMTALLLEAKADPKVRSKNIFKGTLLEDADPTHEELSSLELAVDLEADECAETLFKHMIKHGIVPEGNTPAKKSFLQLDFDPTKSNFKKGRRNLFMLVRRAFAQPVAVDSPLRVYTDNSSCVTTIQAAFAQAKQTFYSAEEFCRPLFNFLLMQFQENPKLRILFIDLSQRDQNGLVCNGSYNQDSGNEIAISAFLYAVKDILPILMHEVFHMYEDLYGVPDEARFLQALKSDLELQVKNGGIMNPFLVPVNSILKEGYHKNEYGKEIRARIPEIILATAFSLFKTKKELVDTICYDMPNLFQYYTESCLPAVIKVGTKSSQAKMLATIANDPVQTASATLSSSDSNGEVHKHPCGAFESKDQNSATSYIQYSVPSASSAGITRQGLKSPTPMG